MVSFITILGALAVAGGGVGYFTLPMGVTIAIKSFINLNKDGMVYPSYMNPPFASTSTYYIYSIENPKDVLVGERMKLVINGPYLFSTYLRRENIMFSESDQRVQYTSRRELHLNEKNSADLDRKLWVLNPIIPAISLQIRSIVLDRIPFQRISEPIVFNSVNVLLDNFKERLISKKSPREVFVGTKIEALEFITGIADRFGLKSLVPPGPPENIFGVAHFQNKTTDELEIWTGIGATKEKFGDVHKWRGKDKMTFWKGNCNVIGGTNGELHKPFISKGKPLKIFLSQLCRTFYLNPVGDFVTIQDGLKALEYELSPRLFLGARNNPNNKCYCSDPKSYDCQYDGLLSMAPCFFDAPLFFSKANFNGVDRKIRSLVNEDALDHNLPEKQSFYLEPITGSVLKANITLVASFKIVRQRYMRDLARVQNLTYAPLFLTNETVEVPSSITWPLKGLQLMMDYYKPFTIMIALGGSGILLLKLLSRNKSQKINTEQEVNQNQ